MALRHHLPQFARVPDAEVALICNAHEQSARAAAQQFGVANFSADWQEAVQRPDIDAVDILTPNASHAPIAIAAARAGKHVLVEKPMATTLAEAEAVVAAARDAGVILMPAMNQRFSPQYEAARDLLAGGRLGRLTLLRGLFSHAGPEGSWGATSDWFWDPEQAGGGALIDLGIHMIDLLRWLSGLRVVEVMAMTATLEKPIVADDTAVVLLRFDSGALGFLQASWTATTRPEMGVTVQGERGVLQTGLAGAEPAVVYLRDDPTTPVSLPVAAASRYVGPCAYFVACIRDGQRPFIDGEEGRASLEVILAAYESARSGRAVSLPPSG